MNQRIEPHTVRRYDGELEHLHSLSLAMGKRVLGQVNKALEAFRVRNPVLARQAVEEDCEIDRMEVEADDEITKLLARRCPMSSDLRLVIAASKTIGDFERIGDEAVKIAGLVEMMSAEEDVFCRPPSYDVEKMGDLAVSCLREALEVFACWDEVKAERVIARCKEMESEFEADLRHLMTYVYQEPRNIRFVIGVVLAMKALERIGHHAHNIVEYVIFQVKGEDIRASEEHGPSPLPSA